MRQVRACRPFLLRVLEQTRPLCVVGLGGTALRGLTNSGSANVTRGRGRRLVIPGYAGEAQPATFVTYDPAAILLGQTHLAQRIVDDLTYTSKHLEKWPDDGFPSGQLVALDTEYGPSDPLITLGLSDATTAVALEGPELDKGPSALVPVQYLAGHSVAGDVSKLAERYPAAVKETWARGDDLFDSLLLARMVDENGGKGTYELENLLLSTGIRVEPWKHRTAKYPAHDAAQWPEDERRLRCRLDAWASRSIAQHFFKQQKNRLPLIRYTHRIASVLERMSLAGAFVHMGRFTETKNKYGQEVERLTDDLRKAAAVNGIEDFSPTNDEHLRVLLYEKLGLPVVLRTKKGKAAVDKLTLKNLAEKYPEQAQVANVLAEFSAAEKRFSVNGAGLESLLHPCGLLDGGPVGWLPFHINPLGARTGRRASSNPNSQNWPRAVRGIVRSRWPNGLVGDHDYQKLEVVLIAWVSGDERLLRDFTVGNGYFDVAKGLLGIDVEKDTPQYTAVKSIALGVHYNMQTKRMARTLWNGSIDKEGNLVVVRFSADYRTHEEEVDKLRKAYLQRYPALRAYMRQQEMLLLQNSAVSSYTGRVRHLPLTDGRETPGYGHLLNQAINFPIQSLASDVTGSALMDIEQELLSLHGVSYVDYLNMLLEARRKVLTNPRDRDIIYTLNQSLPFNEVHDSIIVDFHPDHAKRDQELVVECMRAVRSLRTLAPGFDLKLGVDTKLGPYWGGK